MQTAGSKEVMLSGRTDEPKEAATVKLYGWEVYDRGKDREVRIHGGAGYIRENQI